MSKKTSAQIDREIDEALAKRIAADLRSELDRSGYAGGGRCHDASQELVRRLHKAGINGRLISGNFKMPESRSLHPHWWVEAKGLIIDPTADQFQIGFDEELPKVLVGTYADHKEYVR